MIKRISNCGTALRPLALVMLVMAAAGLDVRAEDWPHWRGPLRTGISNEKGWRDTWPANGPAIAWKAQVGLGFSAVVIRDGRAFTLGHANGQDTVWCLDVGDGKVVWKHSYPAELGDKFYEGGTTGTPTVAGDRVYTLSRWGGCVLFRGGDGEDHLVEKRGAGNRRARSRLGFHRSTVVARQPACAERR